MTHDMSALVRLVLQLSLHSLHPITAYRSLKLQTRNNARKRERRAGGGGAAAAATARGGPGEGELWATLPTADGGARSRGVWIRQLALGAALTVATVLCRCALRPRGS